MLCRAIFWLKKWPQTAILTLRLRGDPRMSYMVNHSFPGTHMHPHEPHLTWFGSRATTKAPRPKKSWSKILRILAIFVGFIENWFSTKLHIFWDLRILKLWIWRSVRSKALDPYFSKNIITVSLRRNVYSTTSCKYCPKQYFWTICKKLYCRNFYEVIRK